MTMRINDDNIEVRRNSLQAWLLAARPKTLSGAAVPVMLGISLAVNDTQMVGFMPVPALLCVLFAFLMQIDANFINDYFDCVRGNDDETRLGPKRACAEGWISLGAMRMGIAITTLLACLTGLPLIFYGGISMIVVGLLCVVFAFLYTTKLSYLGMGDLLVLVFFGLVPVCVTRYLCLGGAGQPVTCESLTVSIACGLVIDTLLIVNNYRDIDNDRKAGKITLVVRLGEPLSLRLYLLIGYLSVFLVSACWLYDAVCESRYLLLLSVVALVGIYGRLHGLTSRSMRENKDKRELNKLLGETARNIFLFGLITALAYVFTAFL